MTYEWGAPVECRHCGAQVQWHIGPDAPLGAYYETKGIGGRHYCPVASTPSQTAVRDYKQCICGEHIQLTRGGARYDRDGLPHKCGRRRELRRPVPAPPPGDKVLPL